MEITKLTDVSEGRINDVSVIFDVLYFIST